MFGFQSFRSDSLVNTRPSRLPKKHQSRNEGNSVRVIIRPRLTHEATSTTAFRMQCLTSPSQTESIDRIYQGKTSPSPLFFFSRLYTSFCYHTLLSCWRSFLSFRLSQSLYNSPTLLKTQVVPIPPIIRWWRQCKNSMFVNRSVCLHLPTMLWNHLLTNSSHSVNMLKIRVEDGLTTVALHTG